MSFSDSVRVDPILRLRGIDHRFGGVHAVRGVELEVRPGERRAILGPNGAGKTTLFNLISGEFPPPTGSVELFGVDVTRAPARKRARMGLSRTFQTSRLFLGLSVEDNLYLSVLGVDKGHFRLVKNKHEPEMREKARVKADAPPVSVGGVDKGHFRLDKNKHDAEMREKARVMADAVGLENVLDVLVSELSHGEQRQLEVGMARASDPQLMMLDEPAAGLSRAERGRRAEAV